MDQSNSFRFSGQNLYTVGAVPGYGSRHDCRPTGLHGVYAVTHRYAESQFTEARVIDDFGTLVSLPPTLDRFTF